MTAHGTSWGKHQRLRDLERWSRHWSWQFHVATVAGDSKKMLACIKRRKLLDAMIETEKRWPWADYSMRGRQLVGE